VLLSKALLSIAKKLGQTSVALLSELSDKNFSLHPSSTDECIVVTNKVIRIALFSYDYPHNVWAGKLLAEHEVNFDKWSKHFYSVDLPQDAFEMNTILIDIEYISCKHNIVASDQYSKLVRTF
jgi:hypothetical protein